MLFKFCLDFLGCYYFMAPILSRLKDSTTQTYLIRYYGRGVLFRLSDNSPIVTLFSSIVFLYLEQTAKMPRGYEISE